MQVLTGKNAIKTVANDDELTPVLDELFSNADLRADLGGKAFAAISEHAGATGKTLDALGKIFE